MEKAVVRQAGGEVDVDHDVGGFDIAMHVHLHMFVVVVGERSRLGVDESNGSSDVEDYLEALLPIQGGVAARVSSTLTDSKATTLRGFSHEHHTNFKIFNELDRHLALSIKVVVVENFTIKKKKRNKTCPRHITLILSIVA